MPTSINFTFTRALINLSRNVTNYRNFRKIVWNDLDCISENWIKNSELNCSTAYRFEIPTLHKKSFLEIRFFVRSCGRAILRKIVIFLISELRQQRQQQSFIDSLP